MLSEPHPPFSLNKVSGALGLEVPSALQTHRCPMAQPTWTPGLGTQAREWASLLFRPCGPSRQPGPRPPASSRVPSVGGSDSGGTRTAVPSKATGYTPNTIRSEPRRAGPTVTPITLSAGGRLCPIWAQGPHVTSRQTEVWTGRDREARCQLLAGQAVLKEPRPWLFVRFFLILTEGYLPC